MTIARVDELFQWLVDGAPGCIKSEDVVSGLGERLNAAGIQVDRVSAFVRTLHPHVMGRAFHWVPGEKTVVDEASYAVLQTPAFKNNTVAAVYESGKSLRRKLEDPSTPRDYPVLDDLAAKGFTDYVVLPLISRADKCTHRASRRRSLAASPTTTSPHSVT